jgi:hypothetical protein
MKLRPSRDATHRYLFVIESTPSPPPEVLTQQEFAAFGVKTQPVFVGKLLMGCDVRAMEFVSMAGTTDSAEDYARVPLDALTADQLECVVRTARAEQIETRFSDEPGPYPEIIL